MEKKKNDTPAATLPRKTLAPLPETQRGYGFHMNSTKKDNLYTYGCGKLVIVRSLQDPSVSDTFAEHKGRVTVAAFSPNGEWVASGDEEGKVIIWGVKNKIIKNTVQVNRKVLDLAWAPDGTKIVAVGDGAEVKARVFSWDTGNNVGTIEFHSKAILSVSYRSARPFKIVTSSEDLCVNFYDGPPFKWTTSLKDHERYPNSVRFSPDGAKFVSVGSDSKINVYDGNTGKLILACNDANGHKGAINSVSWSPDGKQILTASSDKTSKIWDVETGKVVKTFQFRAKPTVMDMQVSTLWHDDYLLSVSLSGAINYLDVNRPDQPKMIVQGHQHAVQGFSVDRLHGQVFTSDDNGLLAAWDMKTGLARWFDGVGHNGKSVVGVAVNANGNGVFTAGLDDKLKLNESKSGVFSNDSVALGGQPVALAAANKDATMAAVALAQEKLVLVKGGQISCSLALDYRPTCLAFSSDDKELAVGGTDNKVHLFAVAAGVAKPTTVLSENHTNKIVSVNYSDNGQFLVSTDANRYICIWKNGKLQNPTGWTFHNAAVLGTAFPPGASDKLVTCSQDQDVFIWSDLAGFTHKYRRIVLAHPSGVDRVLFLDGNSIISTGQDRTMKVWDA